jgi:hypothetical protein
MTDIDTYEARLGVADQELGPLLHFRPGCPSPLYGAAWADLSTRPLLPSRGRRHSRHRQDRVRLRQGTSGPGSAPRRAYVLRRYRRCHALDA